jgi:carbamate kinase
MKTIVIAFGGNALLQAGQKGTADEQWDNVSRTCKALITLIKQGYNVVIGHGNGPQVGNELLRQSAGKQQCGLEEMPMDFCVAETQGSIGYMIEIALKNEFKAHGIERDVITLLSPVVVDADDKAFKNPTKPVGPYYTDEQINEVITLKGASLNQETQKQYSINDDKVSVLTGEVYMRDAKGNGWRKVVASPVPKDVLHNVLIKEQAEKGTVVIAVGGGGIPVVLQENSNCKPIEAVIDKDLASALLGGKINAEELYILTDVPQAYINFRQPDEQALYTVTLQQAKEYLEQGHFKEGSMAPKIRAAIKFVENGGKRSVITTADNLSNTEAGTRIVA